MQKLKRVIAVSGCAALLVLTSAYGEDQLKNNNATNPQAKAVSADDSIDIKRLSEAFGHFIGKNLKSPGVEFDLESMVVGLRNGANGKPAPMTDQEYEQAMMKLQERAYETLSTQNLESANAFMTQNAKEANVIVLEPNKLQYMILNNGSGATVEPHSSPLIHYTGKYIDGTVFGNSEEVGGPITIPLDQTIPGFSKGLLGMKEGEKRRLFVHPDLGYGTLGNLPPNALLIFDIEVIKADASNSQDDISDNTDMDEDDIGRYSNASDDDDDNDSGSRRGSSSKNTSEDDDDDEDVMYIEVDDTVPSTTAPAAPSKNSLKK